MHRNAKYRLVGVMAAFPVQADWTIVLCAVAVAAGGAGVAGAGSVAARDSFVATPYGVGGSFVDAAADGAGVAVVVVDRTSWDPVRADGAEMPAAQKSNRLVSVVLPTHANS